MCWCCFINMENGKALLPLVVPSKIFKRADWLKTFNMRLYTNILIVIINVVYRFFLCCLRMPYLFLLSPDALLYYPSVYSPSHLVAMKTNECALKRPAFYYLCANHLIEQGLKKIFRCNDFWKCISSHFLMSFFSCFLFFVFPFFGCFHFCDVETLAKGRQAKLLSNHHLQAQRPFSWYIRKKKRTQTQAQSIFSTPYPHHWKKTPRFCLSLSLVLACAWLF